MAAAQRVSARQIGQDAAVAARSSGGSSSGFGVSGKKTVNRKIVAREYLDKATAMLSFDDCPEVCRAVPLEVVTRNCGQLWADSKGSEATYAMSKIVTKIDAFISHNWVVGRFRKWIALCFRFNFTMAAGCTILANLIVTILTLFGVLPVTKYGDDVACLWNGLVGAPVFFFVLFFGRNVLSVFKFPSPQVFLDKTKGIMKLGAFLGCSEEMLILYTNVYLQKLWTIYEVAAFVILRPKAAECMKVIPISLSMIILAAFFVTYLSTASGMLMITAQMNYNYVSVSGAFLVLFYMYGLRAWHRDKVLMQERVLNFNVRECICTVESDRSVVYANIAALVKAFGLTAPTSSLEESLDAFDALVRRELPPAFRSAFGRCAFEYCHYVWIGYGLSGVWVFGHLSILPFTPFPRKHVSGALLNLHVLLVAAPFAFVAFELACGTKLHWKGWKEAVWLIILWVAVWTPVAIDHYFLLYLMANSDDSTVAYAISLAVGILSAMFGIIMFWRSSGPTRSSFRRDAEAFADKQGARCMDYNFSQVVTQPSAPYSSEVVESVPALVSSLPPDVSSPMGANADEESDEEIIDFHI